MKLDCRTCGEAHTRRGKHARFSGTFPVVPPALHSAPWQGVPWVMGVLLRRGRRGGRRRQACSTRPLNFAWSAAPSQMPQVVFFQPDPSIVVGQRRRNLSESEKRVVRMKNPPDHGADACAGPRGRTPPSRPRPILGKRGSQTLAYTATFFPRRIEVRRPGGTSQRWMRLVGLGGGESG
jgi:hypothetical protein